MEWLRFNDTLSISMGVLSDPLSVKMLFVIGVVASMVVVYSVGYMKGERGLGRYFGLVGLFVFSMSGLVVSTNLFQMYVFWELVGASSYLLIGFYYTRPAAVAASKKAFIVTRFADLGFLIGILILSGYTGTFDFATLTANNASAVVGSTAGHSFLGLGAASWAMGLLFMGAAGKSAMFPLHIWLPDAMEGPTPVSALIHAATMVVAGVYLVARMFPVFEFAAPDVLTLITYVGAFTALFAAVLATAQTDIKRTLAFSTISQIAYMMVALGVADVAASTFHLFTHAFFKALLFLGAGSVIHAVHTGEVGRMGGLRKFMPITHATFLIACLSIAGIPPFSGFFSKDEILVATLESSPVVFAVLLVTGALTAFYMLRLYRRVFLGPAPAYEHPPKEAPAVMTVPLIILAVLTCVTGFVRPVHVDWSVASAGLAAALAGIGLALGGRPSERSTRFRKAAARRFWVDEVWIWLTKVIVIGGISRPTAWLDRHAVDGAMDELGAGTIRAAERIRPAQSGKVQTYAVFYVLSVLVITLLTFLVI